MIKYMFSLIPFFSSATTLSGMEYKETLRHHFLSFYQFLADTRVIPEAFFKESEESQLCLLGLDNCYFNMVMGYSTEESHWDDYIEEQVTLFKKAKLPFVWYVDEEGSPQFKEKLIQHGFKEAGVFRGVAGTLDPSFSLSPIPSDSTLELVTDAAAMDEWADLVCSIFAIENVKETYKKMMWDLAIQGKAYHWLARKEGKVVSAVSTLIEGSMVSFWNGASLPAIRRQGYSTALRRLALRHALTRGCQIGASYLMSEGLAFGICRSLGYETKWQFDVFVWDQK